MSDIDNSSVVNYFTLFDLTPAFCLDQQRLDRAYHAIQSRVHPDRFARGTPAERRYAAQWASLANEGYRTLKNPLRRAGHLLQLQRIDRTTSTFPDGFLAAQLQRRETVQEARKANNSQALGELQQSLREESSEIHRRLEKQLDQEQDYIAAMHTLRQLQFLEKLIAEVEEAVATLEK